MLAFELEDPSELAGTLTSDVLVTLIVFSVLLPIMSMGMCSLDGRRARMQ